MKVSELILLGILTVFAGVLLFNSLDMPYSSPNGFDVGFVPLNMSAAMIVLAGLIGLRAVLNRKKTQKDVSKVSEKNIQSAESVQRHSLVAPVTTILLLIMATAAMGFGSILLPLAIVMSIVSALFLKNSWFRSIRMTVLSLAVIYLIFSVWLKIPII